MPESETPFRFELLHEDQRVGARCGRLQTPHGSIDLPAFMPVGTLGTVKGLTMEQVRATGAQVILGNTYHLALRPGEDVVAELGGLHQFTGWDRAILTDSGGFQIFSLANLTKVDDRQAVFRSHIDGRLIEMSPERSIEIQEALGSDIAMVLDDVAALPATPARISEACDRTIAWAERCRKAQKRPDQSQFAIVQGGLDGNLRRQCAERLAALDFPGYAVGGLSVGEPPADMYRMLDVTCPEMPRLKPRYLMGVGRPQDLLQAIARGIDMFDCVMPTRNGRNALAFTDQGPVRLRNRVHERDSRSLQADVESPCQHLSRAYLRHLFQAGEMLGPILVSAHNVAYYQRLVRQAREAIQADSFADFFEERWRGWGEPVCPCPLSGKPLR